MSLTVDVLGVQISRSSPNVLLNKAVQLTDSGRACQIITANALLVLETLDNPRLKAACDDAAFILGESSGIEWAAKVLQNFHFERMAGIDFSLRLCELISISRKAVYLLGGKAGIAEQAASHLRQVIPDIQIAGSHRGFFHAAEESNLIEDIRQSKALLVLVALGMPKQDIWIHEHMHLLPPALYIGVGGSFDVWAGQVKRAPQKLQDLRLEWFYRLCQEPYRWKRILQLPKFAALTLAQTRRKIC